MSCPICHKRKPERFCPAKAEKICAVCCGTEREVSIDCPSDCAYLVAAHRYEDQHQRSLPANTALLDVRLSQDFLHTHQQFLSAIAFAIVKFCAPQPPATDSDVLSALESLANTYKTLSSGIVYEHPPSYPLQRELYATLSTFLAETKQQAAQTGSGSIKDFEIFQLLVFLYRMGLLRTNGRPRSRRFVEFLCSKFPAAPEVKREQSRIIMP